MPLVRKQIYLDPTLNRSIKKIAKTTGLSEAEHVRRAVDAYVRRARKADANPKADPVIRLIGICDASSGPKDGALRHDRYLNERNR